MADGAPMRLSSDGTNLCVPATWKLTIMSAAAAVSTSLKPLRFSSAVTAPRSCAEASATTAGSTAPGVPKSPPRQKYVCREATLPAGASKLSTSQCVAQPANRTRAPAPTNAMRRIIEFSCNLVMYGGLYRRRSAGRHFVTQVNGLKPRIRAPRGRGSILPATKVRPAPGRCPGALPPRDGVEARQ